MKFFKGLAISSSIGLLALAAVPASADVITYDALIPTANGFYAGTGNNTSNFTIKTSDDGTLQLGLKADTAFVAPTLTPDPGTGNYQAATTTTTRFGETVATWDYYFSIDTNANGSGVNLDAYNYLITINDVNTGNSVSYDPTILTDSASMGAGNVVTTGNTNQGNGGVSLTTQFSMQNAENIGFSIIGFGPTWDDGSHPELPTDMYNIALSVSSKATGATVLENSISVNAPEPGTIGMLLGSLGVLGMFSRRRRKA